MMFNKKLLLKLDEMLDQAIAGTFEARTYDESQLSKIESKMVMFLEQSKLKRIQIEGEHAHVHSLISDISHQTKTPLSNVSLYTQLLAEQDLTNEQTKLVDQISKSAETLTFLIQSLVKTSRLESGIIKIEPKPRNVYDLITTAISQCESLAYEKNIKLCSAKNDNPIIALYDPRWCAEALFNIIENAIKYTPEEGNVIITVKEYEMFVCINVTDTGRGIREQDLTKVFGRFWRESESATGVGIGLFLAREVITACGGYIKVDSEIGKGSNFSVFLSKM